MLVEVTLEKIGIAAPLVGAGFAAVNLALYAWARGKFVTRKEWHDANNSTAVILEQVQHQNIEIQAQLEAGDKRMDDMHRDAKETKDMLVRVSESSSRMEGMLMFMGAPAGHRRKGDGQWNLDL